MTAFTLDDALLATIIAGFALTTLYMVMELVTWRFRRLTEIKALKSIRALYQRSSQLTRGLVSKRRGKKP